MKSPLVLTGITLLISVAIGLPFAWPRTATIAKAFWAGGLVAFVAFAGLTSALGKFDDSHGLLHVVALALGTLSGAAMGVWLERNHQ